jgi:hypothetical protein
LISSAQIAKHGGHTGTDCGLEPFVNLRSLLKKPEADVLHSTESTWKWSKREKVKAVEGRFMLAGKKRFLSS